MGTSDEEGGNQKKTSFGDEMAMGRDTRVVRYYLLSFSIRIEHGSTVRFAASSISMTGLVAGGRPSDATAAGISMLVPGRITAACVHCHMEGWALRGPEGGCDNLLKYNTASTRAFLHD